MTKLVYLFYSAFRSSAFNSFNVNYKVLTTFLTKLNIRLSIQLRLISASSLANNKDMKIRNLSSRQSPYSFLISWSLLTCHLPVIICSSFNLHRVLSSDYEFCFQYSDYIHLTYNQFFTYYSIVILL